MFSSQKNVLETIALLKAYNISQVVLSPGSRNTPFIHSFTQDPFFETHLIVDERNAAFFALGIIQKTQQPTVVCCTSGTALLNYAPAVAEAYYAHLPLIVLSADRASEWIGQMDGQTIPQPNALVGIVKKSVHIPEINNESDAWFANRLLNEALISSTDNQFGPVHINVPISEPLFDFSTPELPRVRKINFQKASRLISNSHLSEIFNKVERKMIVVGQMFPSIELNATLEQLAKEKECVVLVEQLSNLHSSEFISNFDNVLPNHKHEQFVPDLLITFGGHIVSKRLKHFLRSNHPKHHWHITSNGEVVDLYQSLTDLLDVDVVPFLKELIWTENSTSENDFLNLWRTTSQKVSLPVSGLPFSDMVVMGKFMEVLPKHSALHLANSSVVRNAQLFTIDSSISIYCNRGTNGIESSLPSAIGYASVSDELTFLAIGDLSFFYSIGALWNLKNLKNLRILLINNHGGSIFHLLPGMAQSEALPQYIGAGHDSDAKRWAEAGNLTYLKAENESELEIHLSELVVQKSDKPILLEVITDIQNNKLAVEIYYSKIKNID